MPVVIQKLKALIARIETWPETVQEEAVEEEFLAPYELNVEDRQAIDRGLQRRQRVALQVMRRLRRYSPNTVANEGPLHRAGARRT
jgi:hypothetical protein